MDTDLRRAAVAALGELGRSADYRDRAAAGHGLAAFAEVPVARGPLAELLLDPGDTFVTLVTARALLRRVDRAGLSLVASALAAADECHGEWIRTAVDDVFGIFADDRDAALRLCEEMARDDDPQPALGVRQLRLALAEIAPVLGPAVRG
ncbi:hypothetical protein ACFW1A_36095 [Kitasatospora sp. NPDC058965]|uniref:hypothetical protein n=1 Tax=Kitasatospora sp. NPDC058965 TaxID=3346682 RepID=UPI0036D1BED2